MKSMTYDVQMGKVMHNLDSSGSEYILPAQRKSYPPPTTQTPPQAGYLRRFANMRGRLNLRPKGCHRRQYFCAYPQAERDSTVGVQGQAPSDDPELARFLVEQ